MKLLSRFFLGADSHITYPHTNAFAFGGSSLVYSQRRDGLPGLYLRDLTTHETMRLPDIRSDLPAGTYDIALNAAKMCVVVHDGAWILDLENPKQWVRIYQAVAPATLDVLCSISPDGTRMLCRETLGESRRAIEIDVKTGESRQLFAKDWFANHFHYCPHDDKWIAFAHEGPAEAITDRCWAWHPEKAPQGKVVFDQVSDEPGKLLCVGHERWAFHDTSAYVIAYAVSPAGKRGLYEIFADDRPARLLYENDVLWHCNMDLTGRFVVVDFTGPFLPGKLPEELLRESTDLHLKTDRERGRNLSDVVLIDLQTGETLQLATVERTQHPYHPHPHISPDRKWVIWNDANSENRGAWLASISVA